MPAFNAQLNMAGSYYVASANMACHRPALRGQEAVDLVVVGGGCTGLSAALHAQRQGRKVVVLEGGRVGWGASGRNGGQLIPGLRKGAVELVHAYGESRAKALFDISLSARDLILDLIERYKIDCDLRLTGHVLGGVKAKQLKGFEAEVAALQGVMKYPHAQVLDRDAVQQLVASPDLTCGLLDGLGGHYHPLNYTLGLARAAEAEGVRIFESSAALSLARTAAGVRVATAEGEVTADCAVLAGDALLAKLYARVTTRIMPVASYVVATEARPDIADLIPGDQAVSDARFVVDYFRRTADGRLLFGGGEAYTPSEPSDIAGLVRPYVERAFPSLKGVGISHAWGGMVSITRTRLPHIGRDGPILWAHGYSGQGALLSTLGGKVLADALAGDAAPLEALAAIEPPAFPGGALLRWPLYLLGMAYYATMDRL